MSLKETLIIKCLKLLTLSWREVGGCVEGVRMGEGGGARGWGLKGGLAS